MLQQGILLVQSSVHNDFVRCLIGVSLKLQSKPTVALNGFVKIDGRNRICKSEEVFVGVIVAIKSFLHQVVLVLEHFLDPALTDVAAVFFFSVNRIREIFVIGAHRFRDCPRCSASAKKMPNDFLSCTNFGKGPVKVLVQVDPERFLLSGEYDAI